jgi:hypothetical protein
VSNHLTGEITDEIVERAAAKNAGFYDYLSWDKASEEGKKYWRNRTRQVLEEAVREPVVLCKNCKKAIYKTDYVMGNPWGHSGDGYRMRDLKAEPEDG